VSPCTTFHQSLSIALETLETLEAPEDIWRELWLELFPEREPSDGLLPDDATLVLRRPLKPAARALPFQYLKKALFHATRKHIWSGTKECRKAMVACVATDGRVYSSPAHSNSASVSCIEFEHICCTRVDSTKSTIAWSVVIIVTILASRVKVVVKPMIPSLQVV